MKIKNILKRVIHPGYISKTRYLSYVENLPIQEKTILLECQHGTSIQGNIFYLLKELCENEKYADFRIYVSVNKKYKEEISKFLQGYSLKKYQLLTMNTSHYYKAMASTKFLINDNTFLPFYIKKENQIYLNTWHGTPLKTLGKNIQNDYHNIGNAMKNFIVADYLLYPNEHTKKYMIEDYMLENLSKSTILIHGYPRNSIFFDEESEKNIKEKYNLYHKKIIAYMPTWRGTVLHKEIDSQIEIIQNHLHELEKQLDNELIVYVNLHPILHKELDFSEYKKIKPFPKEIETYEFLNACDILISDYSSVIFDFANKKRKIILFTYDEEEYVKERGLYLSFMDLPFSKVTMISELIREIHEIKPIDYQDFIEKYCAYENKKTSRSLLDHVIFQQGDIQKEEMSNNGKENILIYGGNLAKNGITSSLFNLFNELDLHQYNYYLTFTSAKASPYKQILKTLPQEVHYFPTVGNMNASIYEKGILALATKIKSIDLNQKLFDKLYTYEIKRCYGNSQYSNVIHFSGYEMKKLLLFGRFDNNRIVFVHSNMTKEVKLKKNQKVNSLVYAYNQYDEVAVVSEDMKIPTLNYCKDENKIHVVHNIIDYQNVLIQSKKEMHFDENTESNRSFEEIIEIMHQKQPIFMTIGRFSREKGHFRLLKVFDCLWKENQEIMLIIIGGYGDLYQNTIDYAASLSSKDHIIIIKSLSNPYSFLKHANYFVFTSYYEAFGLVLAEANILGIPVMSTNILGPRGFMMKYGGLLVDNSEEGIYQGMKELLTGNTQIMKVNYQKYNEEAIAQFLSLLK